MSRRTAQVILIILLLIALLILAYLLIKMANSPADVLATILASE